MSTDYSEAAGQASETNPLRISNYFHLAVGVANVAVGGVAAFLIARSVEEHGAGGLSMLAIAATLLVVGLHQVGQAWRDEKFKFQRDDIGDFAVPDGSGADAANGQARYLISVLNDGVQPPPVPDNALVRKLYNLLSKLEFAPQFIRWHAETQMFRIVNLVVAVLGLLLAWIFSKPHVFALLAPLYLLLTISPVDIARNLRQGRGGDQQLSRPRAPTPVRTVGILFFSMFVPILLGLLPEDALPTWPFQIGTIVIPTVTAMAAMLVASALFVISLRMQTRDLTTSGVGNDIRKDLDVALGGGLIESLESDLPYPRKRISPPREWQQGGEFGGAVLVEADTAVDAVGGHGNAAAAIRNAWAEREQRPLVALGGLGVVLGLLATGAAFLFTQTATAVLGLASLTLFSVAQFSLLAARGLWNRVDLESMIYRIEYTGRYSSAQRVAGNTVTGSGTYTETTHRVESVRFTVCVAQLRSVAFARKGPRYVQSVDLKPAHCDEQYRRIRDHHAEVMRRKGAAYQEEGQVRRLVDGGGSTPTHPPHLPDETDSATTAVLAEE